MPGLDYVSSYIPAWRPSLSRHATELGVEMQMLAELPDGHGLDCIAVEQTLRVHDMAAAAADRLLQSVSEDKHRIGLLLCTSTFPAFTPDHYDAFGQLQTRWGLEHVPVRFVSQMNCASIDLLLRIAANASRHLHRSVLLLAADKMILPHSRYLRNSTISADAAVAGLIAYPGRRNKIIASVLRSDATLYHSMLAPEQEYEWFQNTFILGLVKVLHTALAEANIAPRELSLVMPSNINRVVWEQVALASGLPASMFFCPTLPLVGHAHNADPLLNLEAAQQQQRLRPGDWFATLTVGMGSTFGCTIFRH